MSDASRHLWQQAEELLVEQENQRAAAQAQVDLARRRITAEEARRANAADDAQRLVRQCIDAIRQRNIPPARIFAVTDGRKGVSGPLKYHRTKLTAWLLRPPINHSYSTPEGWETSSSPGLILTAHGDVLQGGVHPGRSPGMRSKAPTVEPLLVNVGKELRYVSMAVLAQDLTEDLVVTALAGLSTGGAVWMTSSVRE